VTLLLAPLVVYAGYWLAAALLDNPPVAAPATAPSADTLERLLAMPWEEAVPTSQPGTDGAADGAADDLNAESTGAD
jgi:hypothetical protein